MVKTICISRALPQPLVPETITTWEWLFEPGEYSPLFKTLRVPLAGYVNAITKERLDWDAVKVKATLMSTVLDTGVWASDRVRR